MRARCSGCGKTYRVKSTRIRTCPGCGGEVAVLDDPEPVPEPFDVEDMVACPSCSALNPPGAESCGECAEILGDATARGRARAAAATTPAEARRAASARRAEQAIRAGGGAPRLKREEIDELGRRAGLRGPRIVLRGLQVLFVLGALRAVISVSPLVLLVIVLPPSLVACVLLLLGTLVIAVHLAAVLGVAHRPMLWGGLLLGFNLLQLLGLQQLRGQPGSDVDAGPVVFQAVWTGLVGLSLVALFQLRQARRDHPFLYLTHVIGNRRPLESGEEAGRRLDLIRRQSNRVVWRTVLVFLVGAVACVVVGLVVHRGAFEPGWALPDHPAVELEDGRGVGRRVTGAGLAGRDLARASARDRDAPGPPDLGPPPTFVVALAEGLRESWRDSSVDGVLDHVHAARRGYVERRFELAAARGLEAPWPEPGDWSFERTGEETVTSSFPIGAGRIDVTWTVLDGLWGAQDVVPRP